MSIMPSTLSTRYPSLGMIKRELITSLRSKRSIMMLLAFMGFAILILLSEWPSASQYSRGLADAGRISKNLVNGICMSIFAGCVLFVPAYSASTIVIERERSTYDLLRMSLISPMGIVIAKLLNATGMFVLIIVAMVPVLSTMFFLVGVDYTVFIQVVLLLFVTVLSYASIGLACSAVFRKSIGAIVGSYVGIVMLTLGPIILAYLYAVGFFFFYSFGSIGRIIDPVAEATIPIVIFERALQGQGSFINLAIGLSYQLVVICFCLLITYYKVKQPPRPPKISQEKPIDDVKVLHERKVGFPFYILDPLKRKKPIEDSRNPMMVREIRWGIFNRGTMLVRVFYIAFLIYFIAGAIATIDGKSHESMGGWFLIQIILTIFAAPGLIANSLTKEYELGNLDMLRMTLLLPRHIILGKYTAGFASLSPMLFAAIFSIIPVMLLGMTNVEIMLVGYGTLIVCAFLSISIGLLSSLITKQTTVSIMLSYTISFVVYVGLVMVMDWLDIGSWKLQAYFSPVTLLIETLDVSRGGVVHFTGWLWGMGIWLFIAMMMLMLSVYLFYRNKMQDS